MKMSMLFKRKRTVRTLLPASEMSKVTAASVRYISRDKENKSFVELCHTNFLALLKNVL